jgi:hypothetical protein
MCELIGKRLLPTSEPFHARPAKHKLIRLATIHNKKIHVQVAVEICCDSSKRVLQAIDSCARGPRDKVARAIVH